MNVRDSFLHITSRVMIYIGNLFPLFVLVYMMYFNSEYTCYALAMMFISILTLFYWKVLLNASTNTKSRNVKNLKIKEAKDSTSAIMAYVLTYITSIPALLFFRGLTGLIILLFILLFFYLVSFELKIAFYNPLLYLFRYKMYQIETEEHAEGYLIAKIGGINYKPLGEMKTVQLDDFIFIVRQSRKKINSNDVDEYF